MANVCQTCGDEGFVGALVHCDSCKLSAVHRYCCGITPVPIDGYVTWFCSDCDESDTASDSVHVELQDTSNDVEVSSSPPVEEPETTREIPGCSKSNESTGLLGMQTSEAGDGASLLQMSKNKKKKKKRKIITHSLPDAPVDETMEVSKKQDGSENGESDELVGLARDEVSVLEKTRKKKKKKKKTDKGEEKKSEESSNHSLPVLEAGGHELQASTSVEPMKESKKRKISDSKESELNGLVGTEVSVLEKSAKKKEKKKRNGESSTRTLPVTDAEDHVLQDVTSVEATKESTMPLNVLAGNEASVLEKNAKKKKKKKKKSNEENSNHTSPVLKAVDCGHQDTTSVEAMKESMKHKTSDELIGEKREKRKKTNAESSNHTPPVLPAKDNVEPAKAQESSASRKHHELAGLEKIEASVSEGGNSANMPDHNSCTTSKKTSISSRKIQVTNEIMESPANNTSCKDAESNMPALDNDRAQPIYTPVWRGSVTVKEGNICSIDGLVAHLSTLACHKVHEKACSLCTRLSAEMFPRLDIWPPSFLSNGSPNDDDIALYFFPSSPDSNGEKVYYSLVDEMKKKDLAMRCLLDDVELLIFTSYQLPLHCWKFHSKEYLWGSFRRRKTFRH